MQERVYKKSICDVVQLKQRLVQVSADFKQTIVEKATDQCSK